MSNSTHQSRTGRIAIAALLLGIVNLLILFSGLLYLRTRMEVIQRESQSSSAALGDRLQSMDTRFSEFAQRPLAAVAPLSVADRNEMLVLLEKTIPTIKDSVVVRRKADNTGFEFTFTLTNTSGIVLECTTPEVEMTLNDYPPSETNPNLVEDEAAADIGLLAPGASYSTIWYTTELVQESWMQFSGVCLPIQVRLDELTRMMTEAAIPLDQDLLKARYGSWTSTRTAR